MSIEELDITPNEKGLKYKKTQFSKDNVPFCIHTHRGDDGFKCITLCWGTLGFNVKKFNVNFQNSMTLGTREAKELVELLQHSIDYLDG